MTDNERQASRIREASNKLDFHHDNSVKVAVSVDEEVRNRVKLAIAAYAYEYKNDSIMSDHEFDELSYKIDLSVDTGSKKWDKFFRQYFEPATGMWIRMHKDKRALETIYQKYYKSQ